MAEDFEKNEQQETGKEKQPGEPVISGSTDKEKEAAQIVADFFDSPVEEEPQAKPGASLGETTNAIMLEETITRNLSAISGILGHPVSNELLAGKTETTQILSQPDFHNFLSALLQAGYKPSENDFFPSSRRMRSKIFDAYRSEVLKMAIIKEENNLLARRLDVFNSPYWDLRGIESLLGSPNALANIKILEQKFGYDCSIKSDDDADNLMALLANQKQVNDLCSPATEHVFNIVKNLGYTLDTSDVAWLIRLGSDKEFLDRISDPTMAQLIKNMPPPHTLESIDAFASLEVFRPVLKRLVGEFNYSESLNIRRYAHRLQELRNNPQIFKAVHRLKGMGVTLRPIENYRTLKAVVEHNLFSIIERCKDSPKTQGFVLNNPEEIATIPAERLGVYMDIFHKIDDSPSREIQRLKGPLLAQLLKSTRPVEDYQKIESIFIKNNTPIVGKIYGVFEILYDPKELERIVGERTSPVLKQASRRKRYYTIYQDLLKVHIESGNRSMKEYAEVLQSGGLLVEQYERDGLESLNPRQQQQLRNLVGKLETLQAKSRLDTADDAFKAAEATDFQERFKHVREGLKVAEGQTILERISEMYLRPAGFSSLDEVLEKMRSAKASADQRSRQIVAEAKRVSQSDEIVLELKSGDFLKGVNANYIGNILQNGSVAKEFLGESSSSDSTPLDTDISLVTPEDAEGGFTHAINSSLVAGTRNSRHLV